VNRPPEGSASGGRVWFARLQAGTGLAALCGLRGKAAVENNFAVLLDYNNHRSGVPVESESMSTTSVRQCQCPDCLTSVESPTKELHRQMLCFFHSLGERQRRLYAALEARKFGRGGQVLLSLITGLHVQTIRRGLHELDEPSSDLPPDRARRPGGGRPRAEKKLQGSSMLCEPCSRRRPPATP
jgi:hypothetical protein